MTVDSSVSLKAESYVGQGYLHSVFPQSSTELQRFAALTPGAWRSSVYGDPYGQENTSRWNAVKSYSVPSTFILSDMWRAANGNGTTAPWMDWMSYRLWVESTVIQLKAAGYRIDYWEVFNEPDLLSGFYDQATYATVTPQLLLQQYLVAYEAIRSVDSAAQVIGPSLASFTTITSSKTFSLDQFLRFADAQGIQLAALTWHHNGGQPDLIYDEAQAARAEVARYTHIGHPRLFINEYGSAADQRIPGWDVAYLAALNGAGIDQAVRSCWYSDCSEPTLDGLLSSDGAEALPDYWVRLAYAQLAGNEISSSSTASAISSVSSLDSQSGAVTSIIGRGVGCSQDPRCPPGQSDLGPETVDVSVKVPQGTGTAEVLSSRIPGQSISPTGRPEVTSVSYPITAGTGGFGWVQIHLPRFNDGDVEVLQIRPTPHPFRLADLHRGRSTAKPKRSCSPAC